jgi:hypothetical protein
MEGKLDILALPDLIQALSNSGQSGRLRIRPADEARLYFLSGRVVHAEYRTIKGISVMYEVFGWRNDLFRFDAGELPKEQSITMPVAQLLLTVSEFSDLKSATSVTSSTSSGGESGGPTRYYGLPVPPGTLDISPLETRLIGLANGSTMDELATVTGAGTVEIARALKHLLDRHLLRLEDQPWTPQALKAITPRYVRDNERAPQKGAAGLLGGLFGGKKKPLALTEMEWKVYDAIDGRRTLWDIRVNFNLSREDVWKAYQKLEGMGEVKDREKSP